MNTIHSNDGNPRRGLVVGAGIAGLTAMIVLRRAGWQVDVVERAPSLADGGYKVDVRGSAVEVLRRLDLLDGTRRHHCGVRAGSVVTRDGRTVAAMGGDTFGGRGEEDVEIERGDLLRLLAGAAGEIRWGTTPTSVRDTGTEVEVTFTGGEVQSYDVVLGADGVHSAVRRLAGIAPDEQRVENPLGYAIAVADLPVRLGLDREEVTYVRPGATALAYATATHPRARAMVLLRHDGPIPASHDDRVALLRRALPDEAWRLPELHAAFVASPGFYLDAMEQVVLDTWHRGRVGLVGDAAGCASPASGQGTTLALLGGYVTATLLAAQPDDPDVAFATARERLAPLVATNQTLGRRNIRRMVLGSDRAVRTTLLTLRVLRALHAEDAVLGTVARSLSRASRLDLDRDLEQTERSSHA